jgi:iron complex transport system ATP-binding protein
MTLLALHGMTVLRGGRRVLGPVDLTLVPGECAALIGPNGAGKTTLMRAALGLLACTGRSSLAALPSAERARAAAFLPQGRAIAWPVTVERLVALGRMPHRAGVAADTAAVAAALAAMDLAALRDRPATALSGGEQARALIARVLAQEAPLILADEPTAGLDPAAQIRAMESFAAHARAGGAVLVSLHDLGLAARHCGRLILLDGGRVVAEGPPRAVLTAEHLAGVFGIRAHLSDGPDGPIFQPLARTGGA